MPITYDPRPTFLLRRTLMWLGAPRPGKTLSLVGTDLDDTIRNDRVLEAWWTELEGLIVALMLAGYECPELIVARPKQPTGWLRLPCWMGLVKEWDPEDPLVMVGEGDWTIVTGVSASDLPPIASTVTLLRVEVRRTIDTPIRKAENRPPRFPPIRLEGLVSGYHPGPPGTTDPFADPMDGWIAFSHLPGLLGDSGSLKTAGEMGKLADEARDAVVDALVDAWIRSKSAAAEDRAPDHVGILRCLDPQTWDSPLDRACWVWPFDVLIGEIWASANPEGGDGSRLRELLKEPIDANAVSLRRLADDTSVKVGDAIGALRDRGERMGLNDASLELALAHLPSRHWLLALFALHECSLVRILPFPVDHGADIRYIDLTGWYETTYADEHTRPVNAAMQLNQAGDRLVGWFQDVDLERWDLELQLVAYDPAGTEPLAYAGTFTHDGQTVDGMIQHIPREDADNVTVLVSFSRSYFLTRQHRHALTPPPVVLSALGAMAPAGLETQILPLHSHVQRVVDEAVDMLIGTVEDMQAFGTDSASWWLSVDVLERDLRGLLDVTGVLRFGSARENGVTVNPVVETRMVERFRLEAQRGLRGTVIKRGEGGDGLTRLRQILYRVGGEDALPSVAQLEQLVGVTPQAPHAYTYLMGELGPEAQFQAVGWLSGGAALIPTIIWHLSECAPDGATNHGWREVYGGVIYMGSAGVGPELDFQATIATVSTPNDLSTILDWGPEDFVPSVIVIGETAGEISLYPSLGGAKAGPGVVGGPELEGYTIFSRKGMATGKGSGWYFSAGASIGERLPILGPVGFGWSILGLKVGALVWRALWAPPSPPGPPPTLPPAPFPLTMTVEQISSFGFDEAELSPRAQDEIAKIVARHRQLLEWPHSRIEIEGDASPPGTDPYNDLLSWKRALAVYTHVMRLLSVPASPSSDPTSDYDPSNALAIRHSNVQLVGFGESRVKYPATTPLKKEDWQRAKLVINGQVVVFV